MVEFLSSIIKYSIEISGAVLVILVGKFFAIRKVAVQGKIHGPV